MRKTFCFTKKDGATNAERLCSWLTQAVGTLANGNYTLAIERRKEKRTLPQNSLMWLWFNCIAEETGTPTQDVHDYYCNIFLKREVFGVSVPRGTSKLNTKEMTDFLKKVKADVATELGIVLPLPEDMYFEEFAKEYGEQHE